MCTYLYLLKLGDRANRNLHALCNMVLGAEYSDPATVHGLNPSGDVPGRRKQPWRPAQKPPGSFWRCLRLKREELAWTSGCTIWRKILGHLQELPGGFWAGRHGCLGRPGTSPDVFSP